MSINPEQTNWAAELTARLIEKTNRVQLHAAGIVQRQGGHAIAQDYAAMASREALFAGQSPAIAVEFGIRTGMKVNKLVTVVHHI